MRKKFSRALKFFYGGLFDKKNLSRDLKITFFAVFCSGIFILFSQPFSPPKKSSGIERSFYEEKNNAESTRIDSETISDGENYTQKIENYLRQNNTESWKKYENKKYGFSLRHPEDFSIKQTYDQKSSTTVFQFRRKKISEEKFKYLGFDVIVYEDKKIQNVFDTEEFPAIKKTSSAENSSCGLVAGKEVGGEKKQQEVHFSPEDSCHEPAFFYTAQQKGHVYNLKPRLVDPEEFKNIEEKMAIFNDFPDFFSVAENFNLIDITQSVPIKKTFSAPKILNAPPPKSYKKVNGKKVCAKKNDHPRRSNQGKKIHMDMECCLDPDEYHNPHCYYPPEKYGKLLERANELKAKAESNNNKKK